MINIQTALSKEVGDFFHNAWETIINAIAGRWGDILIIGPDKRLIKARVVKGAFSVCYEFVATETGDKNVSVTEHPVESFSVMAFEMGSGTAVFAASGKNSKLSIPVIAGKKYFLFMNGSFQ